MLVLPVLLHLSRVSDQMCMCIFPFFPLGMLISPTGPQLRLACMLGTGRLAVDLIVPVSCSSNWGLYILKVPYILGDFYIAKASVVLLDALRITGYNYKYSKFPHWMCCAGSGCSGGH